MAAIMTEFAVLEAALLERRSLVDSALRRLWQPGGSPEVAAAVEDSLFAPAKRLRPVLALLVADLFGGAAAAVLPAG